MCIYIYTHLKLDLMTFSHPHTHNFGDIRFLFRLQLPPRPRGTAGSKWCQPHRWAPLRHQHFMCHSGCVGFGPCDFCDSCKRTHNVQTPHWLDMLPSSELNTTYVLFVCQVWSLEIGWNIQEFLHYPLYFFGLIITWAGTWDLKIVAVRQHPQKSDKKSAVLRGNFGFLAAVKQPDRLFCRSRPVFHQESSGIWPISIHEFHVLRKHHTHMTHIYSCLYEIDWYENGAPLTSSCCWNHF